MHTSTWIASLALSLLLVSASLSAVKPHGLFCDNAVLQRGMSVPVWGTAGDGERVTVELQGQKVSCLAKDGRWMVRLKPLAPGGPFVMKINDLEIKNVLVGEVWVCGGQSNMQWAVSNCENAVQVQAESADSMLRIVNMESIPANKPRTDLKDPWMECGPKTVGGFSGVGYFFGRELRKSLNVPVGLIDNAIGGTRVQAWTSRRALGLPEDPSSAQEAVNDANEPSVLYNGMVSPLLPYAIRGVIWYQGESNAGEAIRYRTLFPQMIANWRESWGQGDFPFLFVQLAPFGKILDKPADSAWAEVREAQYLTTKNCPNTAMAVITDVGDPNNVHPIKKQPVGYRLALAARATVYGERIDYQSPTYASMQTRGSRAIISFDNVGAGLEARGGDLTGFAVAGPDKVFHSAAATIQGARVVVSSPDVSQPVAVRFAWAECPVVNLFSKNGLPVCPFRTDDFPAITAPH